MRAILPLFGYALLWGLVVEAADRLAGDPFDPLDALTLAVQISAAILLWPLARRVWRARAQG